MFAGPPFARYHALGEGRFEIEAGCPGQWAGRERRCHAAVRAAQRAGRRHPFQGGVVKR